MKRVVAITIMLVVVTSLFAFSVYAETPVQPLQVITYSDTSTNVRISGTAERLHYNVDSFQVVFMNPPNNYGTACTPVLVSFRFYNSSELPAYVGQAEFELTATTGTGAVNTIIYGYDQISTDLFVAESSYSTAEVGRIGIGASNDFAYYTGFVIPPKTSLYFSCIVYVNASAYGQNNTGATEDVNQVTLSTLNLYTNQLSFSADYPYHNQPIDFSAILDAIDDLKDTVSTSSEMQSIINVLTYSGGNFNPGLNNYAWSVVQQDVTAGFSVQLIRNLSNEYYLTNDIELNTTNDTIVQSGTKARHVNIIVRLMNYTGKYIQVRNNINFENLIPYQIGYGNLLVYSQLFDVVTFGNYSNLSQWYFKNTNSTYGYIPPGDHFSVVTLDVYYDANGNVTFPTLTTPDIGTYTLTDNYYPSNVYMILRDLYLSLVKKDQDDNTEEAQDMNDDIHEQEQVWYDNNSDALEAVGLSNYRFSQSQSSGITTAVTQFQAVWNALGNWTNVYIFILILSISTYIIRHEPTTRVKQYRSSVQAERAERISYYGRKNAESRASSSGSTLKNAIRRRK